MKKNIIIALLFFALLVSSCEYQKNNSAFQKDVRRDDEHIYGKKGQPARQIKLEYPADPALEIRTNKIREKLRQ